MCIAMRVGLERYNVIAVCIATTLVMNKPLVVLYPSECEASPRQRSIDYVGDLKFLSGICHRKRWLADDLGKRLFDIGLNVFRFRDHFKLPVQKVFLVKR